MDPFPQKRQEVKNLELGMESKAKESKQMESKKRIADTEVRRWTYKFPVLVVRIRHRKSIFVLLAMVSDIVLLWSCLFFFFCMQLSELRLRLQGSSSELQALKRVHEECERRLKKMDLLQEELLSLRGRVGEYNEEL